MIYMYSVVPQADRSYPRAVRRTVEIVDHDLGWAAAFAEERERIAAAVPPETVIEHIGSTSIPGMPAKPTLDIMIVTDRLAAVLAGMESIGYEYRPGSFDDEPDHFFLRRICGGRRTHHVHLLTETSPRVAQYRLFRDYLIATPDAAALYAGAKRDLAARYAEDRGAYIEAKSEVVEQLMQRARR
jgi:GrpB-like predicted nucleotidyltransferase (UPF0157 family)